MKSLKDTFGTIGISSSVERLDLFWKLLYRSAFRLSFVGRFVLFKNVLYRRFHCSSISLCGKAILMSNSLQTWISERIHC